MIITLKDLDLKKPDNQVDFFTQLHFSRGKEVKICGLVGPELKENSTKELDFTINADQFVDYAKDKKAIKKIAEEFDFFIAQGNLMGKVAQTFGRVFGPRNKMPNPKSGAVVTPNANLAQVRDRLKMTVRVTAKTSLQYQTLVGKSDMKDEEVVDNIMTIYDQLIHHLPGEKNNIKSIFLKTTMGPAIKVGSDKNEVAEK
jgi:large subunit ribosomal protein L1